MPAARSPSDKGWHLPVPEASQSLGLQPRRGGVDGGKRKGNSCLVLNGALHATLFSEPYSLTLVATRGK